MGIDYEPLKYGSKRIVLMNEISRNTGLKYFSVDTLARDRC